MKSLVLILALLLGSSVNAAEDIPFSHSFAFERCGGKMVFQFTDPTDERSNVGITIVFKNIDKDCSRGTVVVPSPYGNKKIKFSLSCESDSCDGTVFVSDRLLLDFDAGWTNCYNITGARSLDAIIVKLKGSFWTKETVEVSGIDQYVDYAYQKFHHGSSCGIGRTTH